MSKALRLQVRLRQLTLIQRARQAQLSLCICNNVPRMHARPVAEAGSGRSPRHLLCWSVPGFGLGRHAMDKTARQFVSLGFNKRRPLKRANNCLFISFTVHLLYLHLSRLIANDQAKLLPLGNITPPQLRVEHQTFAWRIWRAGVETPPAALTLSSAPSLRKRAGRDGDQRG